MKKITKKLKLAGLLITSVFLLTACDLGKEDTIKEIKYDMSVEYDIPISNVEVETIEYGVTKFSRVQFKVDLIGVDKSFYFVQKDSGSNFTRIPIIPKDQNAN